MSQTCKSSLLLDNNHINHDACSTVSAIGIPRIVGTIDPRNVEHVLKSMYTVYPVYTFILMPS